MYLIGIYYHVVHIIFLCLVVTCQMSDVTFQLYKTERSELDSFSTMAQQQIDSSAMPPPVSRPSTMPPTKPTKNSVKRKLQLEAKAGPQPTKVKAKRTSPMREESTVSY